MAGIGSGASHNRGRAAIAARGVRCADATPDPAPVPHHRGWHIGDIVSGITWFWPGVAIALVLSWVLAPPVARLLRTDRRRAWLLVFTVALVLAAEATPLRGPFGLDLVTQRPCDLGRRWFATLAEFTAMGDVTFAIALYVPAGVAIALLPITWRPVVAVLGVLALPGLIELLQLAVPTLARGCESGDAIDGLTGLGIGLGIGLGARFAVRLMRWVVTGDRSSAAR